MTARRIIGLATGSAPLGVDVVLLETRGVGADLRVEQIAGLRSPHPPELRDLVAAASSPDAEVRTVSRAHRLLGETYAAAARAVADSSGVALSRVQCIGTAGVVAGRETEGRFPTALSVGMDAVVAERTGVTVVGDFRSRDLAAGGLGAPIATLPDHLLFRDTDEGRLLVHLGDVSRVAWLPAGARLHEATGFEAGPCNLVLDALVRRVTAGREDFDAGGKHAVQGRCLEPMLQLWLGHPALQRRPPRVLPRHAWGDEFAALAVQQLREQQGSLRDLLCTATHFVARCVSGAVRRFLPPGAKPTRVLLSGGGIRNGFLWKLLSQHFDGTAMGRTDDVNIPADLRKPITAAMLAALTLDGVPGNSPGATGAAGSRLLGSLTPGSQSNWARCLAWMAQQTPVMQAAG